MQVWNIKNYEINGEGAILFNIERDKTMGYQCSECGETYMFAYDECIERTVRDLPVWGRKSFLRFHEARVNCPKCGIKIEKHDWLEPYQRMTIRYEKYLASQCDFMPVSDVSEIEGGNKVHCIVLTKNGLNGEKSFTKMICRSDILE
ncbi:MAG: hypothetical protein NC937_04250 [Candidatus Omnitrophica bacterium]|nr:hypothetical protein [Candidatus Omnitrophota bacterium]